MPPATVRPSHNSCRNHLASVRSVFARRLRPRSALVSTGSARCATAPLRSSARETNSQPVHASTATWTSAAWEPADPVLDRRGARFQLPRQVSPVTVSRASKVICRRCTSNPATIPPGATPIGNGAHSTVCAVSRPSDDLPSTTVGTSSSDDRRTRLQPRTPSTKVVRRGDRPPAANPTRTLRPRLLMASSAFQRVRPALSQRRQAPALRRLVGNRPLGEPESGACGRGVAIVGPSARSHTRQRSSARHGSAGRQRPAHGT